MCFHFSRTEINQIQSPRDLADDDKVLGGIMHLFLLRKGYYIARRGFVALSLVLTDDELVGFVEAVKDFIVSYRQLLSTDKPRARL